MGAVIARMAHISDITGYWPKNPVEKKHWCMAASLGNETYYCDGPQEDAPAPDPDFSYSVFSCREAKCQTCLDVSPQLFPDRTLWPRAGQIIGDLVRDPKPQEIHFTWHSLKNAAGAGCEVCSILKEGIEQLCGALRFEDAAVFCLEILEASTVKITHEKPEETVAEVKSSRLAIEFHSTISQSSRILKIFTAPTHFQGEA